ncbi:tryptophan-rich sensory protein [Gammaproteobacteria bacterium]|nr:tryptophan-rich sensory protein [Gammaproteobacteria bacterium]
MYRLNSKANKSILILLIPLTLIVGSFASANAGTDIWYQGLIKSDLNPPGYVFGIVWPILYLLMGITAWRTFETIKNLFYVQLFLNAIWSWLFFSFHLPLISLIDIWLLIYLNIKVVLNVLKIDKLAGLLYTPYILWLLFASYLNLFIVINN